MDSITHIVIGAIIGEACSGKSLGRRAMILGAAAQTLPDIDVVAALWLPPASNLLVHRGITHSLLFASVAAIILSLVFYRKHQPAGLSLPKWIFFFGIQLLTHIFIDAFNAYGAGWFEPFSHLRISFNALYVADPFYLIAPGIVFLGLLISRNTLLRKQLAWFGIIASILYPAYAVFNKTSINASVVRNFPKNYPVSRYFTTPAPFNVWLWYIVAESTTGYYVGYHSVFDRSDSIDFHFIPRQESLLRQVTCREEVAKLLTFSRGYYSLENQRDTLVFNDLRFGQVAGWADPAAQFAFHYYLCRPELNATVMQRGRWGYWTSENRAALLTRIKGH